MPISAENMAKYPGGSIRSPEWLAIRAEVLERDDNRCKFCKVPNSVTVHRCLIDGSPAYMLEDGETFSAADGEYLGRYRMDEVGDAGHGLARIVLTIAHIDQDVTNNGKPGDRPNLAALCQRCHNVLDLPHRRKNAERTRRARGGQQDMFA